MDAQTLDLRRFVGRFSSLLKPSAQNLQRLCPAPWREQRACHQQSLLVESKA